MNPEQATLAAVDIVVAAIERCPQAVILRERAVSIFTAARDERSDFTAAEHAALVCCAEAAIYVLEADPALRHLVTVAALGTYIFRQAVAVAMGGTWTVELVLRDPHLN